jgi:RNA polymerase sigma-70 factor (ECF subfamily)
MGSMTQPLPNDDTLIPTRASLLNRLKDWQDDNSWRDFFNTYRRLIRGVALKSGLTEQEADEVVQETLITVARRIPEFDYDRRVCSFKSWLMNLTRWRIIDQIRKRRPIAHSPGQGDDSTTPGRGLEQLPDPTSLRVDAVWAEEWQRHLLETALVRVKLKVKPEHYQIFHQCVLKERPIKQVATDLGLSLTQVYLAKHRVGAVLKKEIKRIEAHLDEPRS